MPRRAVTSPDSTAIGAYSQAIDTGSLVFLSGQTPVDPATSTLIDGDFAAQVRRCMDNLSAVLTAAGLTRDDVVKCNVFLTDMNNFPIMNQIYAEYFTAPFPARTTVQVAGLPLGAAVEIEMVALRP